MPLVEFLTASGQKIEVEAEPGATLLKVANDAGVPGLEAQCGGNAVCATCHVYLDDQALSSLDPMDGNEDEMLDCTVSPRLPGSRLSCQIVIPPVATTLLVRIPELQS